MEADALQGLMDLLSPWRLLASALVMAGAWLVLRLLRFATVRVADLLGRDRLQVLRWLPVLSILVWTLAAVVIVFEVLQPPANVGLAIIASAGLALGVAAKDLIRNSLQGIALVFGNRFRVGDMIRVGEHYGEVISVDVNAVRIHTFDDSTVTIPAGEFLTHAVVNSNSGQVHELVVIEFRLPATLDVEELRRLAWEAAVSSPYTYLRKPVEVLIEDDFELAFLTRLRIKAYVLDVRLEKALASDVTERMKRELTRRGMVPGPGVALGLAAGEGDAPCGGREGGSQ